MNSRFLLTAIILLAAFVVAAVYIYKRRSAAELRGSYPSPDARFQIEVWRFPMGFSFPGGSSDAPGLVRLVDLRTRKTLQEKQIEMVQLVDAGSVEWTPTNVSLRLLADWNLPK